MRPQGSNAIDIFTKDKDGNGGDDGVLLSAKITIATNGYVLELEFFDGEELTEVYHNIDEVLESIRNFES